MSKLIQLKCQDLLNARNKNGNNIEIFQDQLLNNGHAIREAINANERNYRDLLDLLRKARKFQGWLHNLEPDMGLVKEYYKEVTKSTWAETLPTKLLRWVIASGQNIALTLLPINPIASNVISGATSAIDTFLVDKIIQGWKPNQFVEKHLKPFLEYTQ